MLASNPDLDSNRRLVEAGERRVILFIQECLQSALAAAGYGGRG